MPFALGGRFLVHRLEEGGWLAIVMVIAVVAILVFWPRIVAWIERRWFRG